jgi:aminoglycoside phosphotransferase (APT) family kinase protein
VLHLDFHPQNVFQHAGGPVVIDWQGASRGAAAADVAMSVVLMREVELFPGTPPLMLALYAASRRLVLRFYLARYLATSGLTRAEVERWITCARILRLGLLDVESERRRFLRRIAAAAR